MNDQEKSAQNHLKWLASRKPTDEFEFGVVHPSAWDKNHFEMLILLEQMFVDGVHDPEEWDERLRVDGYTYPTYLTGGLKPPEGHDDYDCIRDFSAMALVKVNEEDGDLFFTDLGWQCAAKCRKDRAIRLNGQKQHKTEIYSLIWSYYA